MRKLIFAGIIAVLSMIAWACYMQYDKKKFIEELSQEPPPKQQVNSTTKDSRETPSDSGISPELIKVFTEIQPIYKHIEEIVRVLAPLDRQIYNNMERQEDILSELKTITNPEVGRKLSEEFESLNKLEHEIGSEMLKLQDKLIPLETELKRILSEYGFHSQREQRITKLIKPGY